ncbi:hypothetical protein ZWY2020_034919 [Hordeum vulgare]|nr:hypothetical protein ZWY2020_034919 [Hordeum vulgare]
MVVLYVDSLVIDIQVPDCPVRAEAWDNKRIVQVPKSKKIEGGYGKLRKTRKISAMLSKLCSEFSENIGTFIEYMGKLDMDDVGSSRNNSNKEKRQRALGDQDTAVEEADNDGGIPEDDAEYLPSSESEEDEEVASTYDSSDAFVAPIPAIPKQNKLTQNKLVSRNRAYATTKERSSSGAEPAKESANHAPHLLAQQKSSVNNPSNFYDHARLGLEATIAYLWSPSIDSMMSRLFEVIECSNLGSKRGLYG